MSLLDQLAGPGASATALVALAAVSLFIGVLLGALASLLATRRRRLALERDNAALEAGIKSAEDIAADRKAALDQSEQRLAATMAKLSHESLERNAQSFLRLAQETFGKHHERARAELGEREKAVEELVKPIRDALERTRTQIEDIEKSRRESFGNIKTLLDSMSAGQEGLRAETRSLVKALRRPEVRGQWGELTLRRIVELAGMVEHCDFREQAHTTTESGAIRPDMIVRLAEGRELVVDVKTPLDAYLDAVDASDDPARQQASLQRHERNLREHIGKLASKAYWSQFESSPEFVILFIPGDQFLSAALSVNPDLLDEGLRQKVILATPSSLMALLKSVAYGWRQLALAENAKKIRTLGEELYNRLNTFTQHMMRIGRNLGASVDAYNAAVGSLERKVLPGARKFTEMGVHPRKALETTTPVESTPRSVEDRSQPEPDEEDTNEPARH